jgi:hypothetical protein
LLADVCEKNQHRIPSFYAPLKWSEKALEYFAWLQGIMHDLMVLCAKDRLWPSQVYAKWFQAKQTKPQQPLGQQ